MEVARSTQPKKNFLQNVRKLCNKNKIVLIFDECTSGFRQTFGGMHKLYGVNPDMAMFGKALGNGYAITAVVGKKEVMESAQKTFISSTFWTERIGPAAALKTLEIMERERSWKQITNTGKKIRENWQTLANHHRIKIKHTGIDALAGFTIDSSHAREYKTLITQEMLKKGYLASTSFYASTAHTSKIISNYIETLDPLFNLISQCEEGRNIESLLEGPICHGNFKRLN